MGLNEGETPLSEGWKSPLPSLPSKLQYILEGVPPALGHAFAK